MQRNLRDITITSLRMLRVILLLRGNMKSYYYYYYYSIYIEDPKIYYNTHVFLYHPNFYSP